jgi:hypothetical protein
MKRTRKPSQRSNKGYALLITVVFIGIALLLLGSVMNWSNSTARQTERNNLFSMNSAAAEAGAERVIAQMTRDFYAQTFQPATNYTYSHDTYNPCPTASDQANWPVKFVFCDANGVTNQTSVSTLPSNWSTNWVVLGNQYANLWAAVAQCTVISTATATNEPYSVPATVKEQFQLASIPLFQFAIFYNMTMEICPGTNMTVNGKTYVNGQIWADPSYKLTFGDTVDTTMPAVFYTRNTNDDTQTVTANPTVIYSVTNQPTTNAPALVLPVGTNSFQFGATNYAGTNSASSVESILNLPPTNVVASSSQGQTYLYNDADLVISNASFAIGTNSGIGSLITAYFQDTNNATRLTPIANNFTNTIKTVFTNGSVKTTNYSTNIAYTFATNTTFYDYREGKTVQAVQLNVGALNSWINGAGSADNSQLNTDSGHYIDSVYIYNNFPASNTNLPAVQVANGATLPTQGLSVATPFPLYVLGNYNASGSNLGTTNVANTAPAAFMADAITLLSGNWNNSYTSNTALTSRIATNTTINAATLEGIVVSTNISGTKYYSGGVENFLRLLESWTGDTLTYNGSIVVMFNSLYATNHWQGPGNYYNIPIRNWGFDLNFKSQNQLPALTPQAKALVRQGWSVY